MKKELIAHKDPKSPVSEIFRTLRTNIQFMNTNKSLKTLLVTSTLPGEGKSWVASNLSVAFAQAGKRVILIDADMRKGRIYNIFGVLPRPGLSNYLSGVNENDYQVENLGDFLRETEVPNLYVMPAGNIPPNPSELLITPQMVNLLEQLKQESDLIIIDGTPSKLVTDAVILSRIVDSTIVVTAHNQTKKDDLQKIVTNIQNVGGKIAGIVLNKIPVSVKKYEQSYYYGSTTMSNPRPRNTRPSPNGRPANRPMSVQNKRDDMKRRVRPENPQLNRLQQERRQRVTDNEQPKALQNKIKIDNSEKASVEKTADILNQINAYLDEEKKNLNNKS